jgi:DNA-directed RNA polymerase specialized sigma24 family protein
MSAAANTLREDPTIFRARLWRSYRILHIIACRILDDPGQARKAVENCWHSACAHAPRFEYEGAFRSWQVRVLIDEALVLLVEKQQILQTNISREADVSWRNCMSAAESNAHSDDHNQVPAFSISRGISVRPKCLVQRKEKSQMSTVSSIAKPAQNVTEDAIDAKRLSFRRTGDRPS